MTMDRKHGFVLENGKYQEILTSDMVENGKWKPGFESRRFLKLHGYLMEVDENSYRDYQCRHNRDRYLAKEAARHNEFSYNSLDDGEFSGEELIVDILTNVEDEVIRRCMIERVGNIVENLPPSDFALVHALYYDSLSEYEYSRISGIPRQTINNRRRRVLGFLKKTVIGEK